MTAGQFKFESRARLQEEGFEIVATIGDQESDFFGGHCGFATKLPNLLYVVD